MPFRYSLVALCVLVLSTLAPAGAIGAEVVAFWGFADNYDFDTNPNKQDFGADVDATVSGDANLQAYLGVADELDDNGGGGFVSYTSPASGITYGPTRSLKFDDARGGGDDFDIGGVSTFSIDKNDGLGPLDDNFGNDAMMYITLNGAGYSDFQIRFDIEGDPTNLPSTFDIFYRVDGPGGIWYRDLVQNNLPLSFMDYSPADPENQFADSGLISLSSLLNGSSTIEIILNDFAENGNGEVEFDNIEILARSVPEPGAAGMSLLVLGSTALLRRRKAAC